MMCWIQILIVIVGKKDFEFELGDVLEALILFACLFSEVMLLISYFGLGVVAGA